MKRTILSLLLLATAVCGALAQNDAMYIYRNDGEFNAFIKSDIDSIAQSHYDADSVYHADWQMQVVYTADSIYRIPLAAIDSVGLITPETIYRDGVVQLSGKLFDYLVSADSLLLTFSPSIPANLIPMVNDKLITTEMTDKLPFGFTGKVRQIENNASGFLVYCDSLALEEAVSQFYDMLEIVSQDGASYIRRYKNRKAPVESHNIPLNFSLPEINIPISLEGILTPKKVFGKGGKGSWKTCIKPTVVGRIVRVVDDRTHISYINLHADVDVKTSHTIEVAGVLKGDPRNNEFLRSLWFEKDIPTPWGIPVYFAYGPWVEASGELAVGSTIYADFRHTVDVTFYPATLPYYMLSMNPIIRAMFQNAVRSVNTIDHDVNITRVDADWGYFAARGKIKVGGAVRVGLSVVNHNVAWLGGEGQAGLRADAEINVDFDDIANAENETRFYDALKNNSSLTIMPYWGIQAVVSGLSDHVQLRVGRDDYTWFGLKWNRDFLPIFSNTKAEANGPNACVTANITNDCLFPYTVGFSLFDENNNRIGEPHWSQQKYRLHKDFNFPLETEFPDLAMDKQYKVYPTLSLCGVPVLASPSADLDMHFPVTLNDFKVTRKQYDKGAFAHEGRSYDYRFDITVTATLDDDAENITDWGYVYLDPNGKEAFISLREFGHSKVDDRWAYFRNGTPPFTCTLYGYVKYEGSDEPVYGEPHDYELEYETPLQFKELMWCNVYYANDNVYGIILAVVEVPPGQDVDLSAYESCGVWMTNNITGMEYYADIQENGSMQFLIPLEIPRDEFEKDYDSFTATCDKILFSTYAVDKDGSIIRNDERVADIIYDVPLGITFKEASITGTQVIKRDEDNRPEMYRTDYSFVMDVTGVFWISAIQFRDYSTISNYWNGYSNWATVSADASYTLKSYIEYDADVNMSHTHYFRMQLTDGSIINSTNSLVFGGVPSNPTIHIGGEPSQAPAINVVREDAKEVFTSPFEIVKENAIIRNRITNKAIEGR